MKIPVLLPMLSMLVLSTTHYGHSLTNAQEETSFSTTTCEHPDLDMLGQFADTACDPITSTQITPTQPPLDRDTLQSIIRRQSEETHQAAMALQRHLAVRLNLDVSKYRRLPCFYVRRTKGALLHPSTDQRARLRDDYTTVQKEVNYFSWLQGRDEGVNDSYRTFLGNLTENLESLKENLRLFLGVLNIPIATTGDDSPQAWDDKCSNTSYRGQITVLINLKEFLKDYLPRDIETLKER